MLSALVHPFLAVALTTCPLQVEVLNAAADRIGAGYITQTEGQAVARRVRDWAAEGRYAEQCDDTAAFAETATRDLRTLDGHFRLTPPPSSGPSTGPAPASLQAWRDEARAAGGGVREVRVLEGNIGYLRLSAFYPWDLVETRLAAALTLLGDVDGLIIDLRRNGGGDGRTADQLVASLLPEGAAFGWIERREGRLPHAAPPRALPAVRADTPVAVLIDRRSGSAAEFTAYTLQAAGRAEVIGDRSGGAAHMLGPPQPLPHGYAISVPDARPVNAVTGKNWEGGGVRPDAPGGDDPLLTARDRLLAKLGRTPQT
ncbi:S41 family peptidase [Brevundimonas sp. NPDC055814]